MKGKIISLLALFFLVTTLHSQDIPIEVLETRLSELPYSKSILEGEISGVRVWHKAIAGGNKIVDRAEKGYRTIYLFVKGKGSVEASKADYEIVPETILVPNKVKRITIEAAEDETLHYLKVSRKLSKQDLMDLKELPSENTKNVYYAKFTDCQSYTEAIKSPNTTSRTILPNKYIPRVAMGTVQTKGPDKVDAHEHPMLEQLFLGLSDNNSIVYADEAQIDFPEYSVLHIPLGSSHSVSVDDHKVMYYVWMDFFLDKKGEEWLNTHKVDEDN